MTNEEILIAGGSVRREGNIIGSDGRRVYRLYDVTGKPTDTYCDFWSDVMEWRERNSILPVDIGVPRGASPRKWVWNSGEAKLNRQKHELRKMVLR